jgi:carbonic anhydrase
MRTLSDLLVRNRIWAARQTVTDLDFFKRLTDIQRPDYLWIGCADSRVPANEIVGLAPGELFVHRNLANLISLDDPNCMAVVEYAVETLGVRHVIVCGHYRCGGVKAALEGGTTGVVDSWLEPLRRVIAEYREQLDVMYDDEARWTRLCELSVVEQVKTLGASDVAVRARDRGDPLHIHGLIYDLADGLLQDLHVTAGSPAASQKSGRR